MVLVQLNAGEKLLLATPIWIEFNESDPYFLPRNR